MSRLPGKRARPVLRGLRRSNAPELPDEIYFSILQRKVLTPNDFTDLTDVEARIHAFAHLYQNTAMPFEWKFTRRDLVDLLDRLSQDETPAAA